MAGRGFSAGVLAQANATQNAPFHLFEAYFDSGTAYATDAARDVVWGGHTYLANGQFLGFDGVAEAADLQVTEAHVQLSGVDQTWVALVLAENYIDRRIVIYKAFLDPATDALVVDPGAIFDGRMDSPTIEEDPDSGKCTVTLTATSHWTDFERRPGRHTNLTEQQIHFPTDTGFRYVSEQTRQITWGALQ